MGTVRVDRPLYLADDGETLVEEGDPRAATVWAMEGSTRSDAEAKRFGYKAKKAPANKAKSAPAEDKSSDGDNVCPECGFEAKSAGGLAAHQRSHED